MVVGSNGASIGWLNEKKAIHLFDDGRIKMDDAVLKTVHP